jgi:hypothetical protein
MLRPCLLFLSFAVAGLAGCKQHPASPTQPVIAAGEVGSRLPDFSVKDLQGRPLSSTDLLGFKFDTMPDMEDPLQFAKGIGVRYPLAVATDDVKQRFGGIEGLPTTMLYDRHGILRTKVIGFEYTDRIEQVLMPLL